MLIWNERKDPAENGDNYKVDAKTEGSKEKLDRGQKDDKTEEAIDADGERRPAWVEKVENLLV